MGLMGFPAYYTFVPLFLVGLGLLGFGSRFKRETALSWGLFALAVNLLFTVWLLVAFHGTGEKFVSWDLGLWLQLGRFHSRLAFSLDTLRATYLIEAVLAAWLVALLHTEHRGWPTVLWNRHWGAMLLGMGAVQGFYLAEDPILALALWIVSGQALVLAVATSAHGHGGSEARGAWPSVAVADLFFLFALLVVYRFSGLVQIGDLASLGRVLASGSAERVFGLKPIFLAAVSLGLAGLARMGSFPWHGWLGRSARVGSTTLGLAAALLAPSGLFLVLNLAGLSSLSPVALGVIAALGALSAVLSSLGSAQTQDVYEALAYAVGGALGLAAAGLGAGMFRQSAYLGVVTGLAAVSGSWAVARLVRAAGGSSDLRDLGGLGRPWGATGGLALSLLVLVGVVPGAWNLFVEIQEGVLTHLFRRTPGIMRLKPGPGVVWDWVVGVVVFLGGLLLFVAGVRLWFELVVGRRNAALRRGRGPGGVVRDVGLWSLVVAVLTVLAAGAWVEKASWSPRRWFTLLAVWERRWFVRHGYLALGTGDLVHVAPSVHLWIQVVRAVVLVGICVLFVWLFVRRYRRGGLGPLLGWGPWLAVRPFLGLEVGSSLLARVARWVLLAVAWVERTLGERLLADWILTRVPAAVLVAFGWMAARVQKWRRVGAVALAAVGLAILAAGVVAHSDKGGRHTESKGTGASAANATEVRP